MRSIADNIFLLGVLSITLFTGCQRNTSAPNLSDSTISNQSVMKGELPHEAIPANTHNIEPLDDVNVQSVNALEQVCCFPQNYVNKIIKVRSARMLSGFIELNTSAKFHPMYFLYGYTRTGADLFGFPVDGSSQFQCRNLKFIIDAQDSKLVKVELEKRDFNSSREVYCDLSFMWHEYTGSGGKKEYVGKLVWIKFHERAINNRDLATINNPANNINQQRRVTTYQTYRYQYSQQVLHYFRPSDYNIQNPPAVDWRDPIYWNNWPVYRGPEPIYIGP